MGGGARPPRRLSSTSQASGTQLAMLPKGAKQGGFMLLSRPPAEVHGAEGRFCVEGGHVYSASVRGYLNLRKQGKPLVLL